MPLVKYLIELPDSERKILEDIVTKGKVRISETSGHRFRKYPDSVTDTSGQDNGIIRTAFRQHPDTLSS